MTPQPPPDVLESQNRKLLRVAFFGDIVGKPGREAFAYAAKRMREENKADAIIVNAENARHGAGLHPAGYQEIKDAGADLVTLGDHACDEASIFPTVRDPQEALIRPSNLGPAKKSLAEGRTFARLYKSNGSPTPIYVTTVTGRVHMKHESSDPFAAMDTQVNTIADEHPDAMVIVEAHCEATSEKNALTFHAIEKHRGRVIAVVGTHTHVQTADPRLVGGVASLTDLGMCGGHGGVIGFDPTLSRKRLIRQSGGKLEPCDQDLQATGALITVDTEAKSATSIELIRIRTQETLVK
ncbi:MAG: TIGR00282 family metallophosphoesterase [Planctomycetota bacterium]